jgi:hypothetical protein
MRSQPFLFNLQTDSGGNRPESLLVTGED